MTWKDKLEIGLKDDAPYRKDNLPKREVRGPQIPTGPGRSPEIIEARNDETFPPTPPPPRNKSRRRTRRVPPRDRRR